MQNSQSKYRIATINIEDIQQQITVVNTINPQFICGNFNIPLEKNSSYKNQLDIFKNSLNQYTLVDIGSPPSYKNKDMVDTRNKPEYDTLQWLKEREEKESNKDYIGVLSNSYTIESKGQFPPLEELNTKEWFAYHPFVWCICKEIKTNLRIFIASFNKVPTWRYVDCLKNIDIQEFGLSEMYYPSKDNDSVFTDLINVVYPKSQQLEINHWEILLDLYPDFKFFGIQDNEYGSDNDNPDNGIQYAYPSVNYGKFGSNYYCWTWEEFKVFLDIDWNYPLHYTMKPFKEWSILWFEYTKMTEPLKGCGSYNNPAQLKSDSGINLGIRLYQYMMSYYTLYMLNKTDVVKYNLYGLSMNLKYKHAFIELYGTLDENDEPNDDVPIEYNIELQREFLKDKIVNTISHYIEECDEAYICIQEDCQLNNELEKEFNTLDTITGKFIIKHHANTNSSYINTSILSFMGRHTNNSVETYSYNKIIPEEIDRLERETIDSNENYIISTMEKKNIILIYNSIPIRSNNELYLYGIFKPLEYITSSLSTLYNWTFNN